MPLQERKYKYNQTILKVFGSGDNRKIKLITLAVLRSEGVEDDKEFKLARGTGDEKCRENIIRARNRIFELAYCNPWEYFFTGTLDPSKYDRSDLDKFHKDLTKWISNQNIKLNSKIKYLFIPELHADGKSWHIHGFISGLPVSEMQKFQLGDKMGKALAQKVRSGETIFNWLAYQKKFGFNDLEPIKNHEAVSKYVTKYISKGLFHSVKEVNAHLFYHSRGLQEAVTIKKGTMFADIEPSFTSDYCSISWLDYSDSLLEELKNSFL